MAFPLRLAAVEELQHPPLRMLRICVLQLPSKQPAPGAPGAEGGAVEPEAATQQRPGQFAASVIARLEALLAEPGTSERLGMDMRLLTGLPAAAITRSPQLLAGLCQLAFVQLCGTVHPADDTGAWQPSFFPATVQIISLKRCGLLSSLSWLPARPLRFVGIDAIVAELINPQPQLAIAQLSVAGQMVLHASVEALASFNCQQISLSAEWKGEEEWGAAGRLHLHPGAADAEQWAVDAAAMQAACRGQFPSPLQQRLVPWAFALQPLFDRCASLCTLSLRGTRLSITFPIVDEGAAAAGPALQHWMPAMLWPTAGTYSSRAATITVDGLRLSLRPGSAGTVELTVRRRQAA